MAREYNLDGLVGPTHHYGGLSFGNIASAEHEGSTSNPRQAAKQGLEKMRTLAALGLPQALMPPHFRPELDFARRLGFDGSDEAVIRRAAEEAPMLIAACYSASAMWTANAATVCPSADSGDGRVHFTPANLLSMAHRSIEAPTTARILRAIFADESRFAHHEPLPSTTALGDEGAANHTRLAPAHGEPGVHFFVYGVSALDFGGPKPEIFPARQTLEASQSVARLHGVPPARAVFAQQNPKAIDRGVFHNDVVGVGNLGLYFCHADSFIDTNETLDGLRKAYEAATGQVLETIVVDELSLDTAVSTYLFNSQLVALPSGKTALIAPTECEQDASVRTYVEGLIASDTPLDEIHYLDVRQSMHGGGGPACLRLRVVLDDEEAAAMNRSVVLDADAFERVEAWVDEHYRDRLTMKELADPALIAEVQTALDELTSLLQLGSIYPFQR